MTVYEFPTPATMQQPPEFTLYSDGHVIYMREVGDRGFELRHAQLEPSGMDELIDAAAAVLDGAQLSYDDIDQFDLSSTYFEIHTDDLDKTVSVYALGEWDEDVPSASDRAVLLPLRERLLDFDSEVQAGSADDLGVYEPERYFVEQVEAADELPDKIDWPWPTLGVEDFEPVDPRSHTRVMTASEVEDVLPLADGDYLIATAPDGGRYVIILTPLLPDQEEV